MSHLALRLLNTSFVVWALLNWLGTNPVLAQSIVPAADGIGTQVAPAIANPNQFDIRGGTQAGANLFHSFQRFGLTAGQTANFLSHPGIQNILGRVTGGEASVINGRVEVTGGSSNLYLMNPAGIVFGAGASLNVPGSFTATTANGIALGSHWFNASGANDFTALGGSPNGLAFLGQPGAILNAGDLSVTPGQSLTLIGGTVVNVGTIAAPGGAITIAAVPGEQLVRISQAGSLLSLDLPIADRAALNPAPLTPLSLPALLTSGAVPSLPGVTVASGEVKLVPNNTPVPTAPGNATIEGTLSVNGVAGLNGGTGGTVLLWAANTLQFSGSITALGSASGGNGGFVDTSGKQRLSIAPTAQVSTSAIAGQRGTWLIDPANLSVVTTGGTGTIAPGGTHSPADSTIDASTIVTALNLNNVTLQADNSIAINAAIDASANANPGNLRLIAPIALLNQPIGLRGSSTLSGTATTVNVGAGGTVQNGVDVAAPTGATVTLAAATYTLDRPVTIAKNVTVRGAGAANTTVSGGNTSRVFQINPLQTVTLEEMTIANGNAGAENGGGIFNNSSNLTINGSVITNNRAFEGGGIYNRDGSLSLNSSTVSNNTATLNGGGVNNLYATLTLNASTISGNTAGYGAGVYSFTDPTLSSQRTTIRNSTLSGNRAEEAGGGLINIRGLTVVQNSTLTNNTAPADSGGGIGNFGRNDDQVRIGNSIIAGNSGGDVTNVFGGNLGTTQSQGYNLVGTGNAVPAFTQPSDRLNIDAATVIAPLANNGGSTQTHALLASSIAIDAGDPTSTLELDQRGGQRGPAGIAAGTRIDIGAYEATSSSLVTRVGDGVTAGSLRAAVSFANGNSNPIANSPDNTIRFDTAGAFATPQTIVLGGNGALELTNTQRSTTVLAPGADRLTVSGNNSTRVFSLNPGVTASLNDLTIAQGQAGSGNGGGILNQGSLSLSRSAVQASTATNGGGIFTTGNLTVIDSTIAGNRASNGGGGLASTTSSDFTTTGTTIVNSTLAGNTAAVGGGVQNLNGLTRLQNTTIANNTAPIGGGVASSAHLTTQTAVSNSLIASNTGADLSSVGGGTPSFLSQGHNLVGSGDAIAAFGASSNDLLGVVPFLAPLGNYGGRTQTLALLPGSPAINAGNSTLLMDQRGRTRVGAPDIGAFESSGFTVAATSGLVQSTVVATNFALPLSVTVTPNNPIEPTAGGLVLFLAPATGASAGLSSTAVPLNAAGQASATATANTIAGRYTVNASAIGGTFSFNLTNRPDVAAIVTAAAGSDQSTPVTTAFATPLTALVTDRYGNPIAGSSVRFSLPTTGASAEFLGGLTTIAGVTNAAGTTTVPLTANSSAGSYLATGSVEGIATAANFNLRNRSGAPASLTPLSRPDQSTIVGTTFPQPLRAIVRDIWGNPVSNAAVSFSVPAAGPSGRFAGDMTTIVVSSDADGVVTAPLAANTRPGSYTATGTVPGLQAIEFNLTNLIGPPAALQPISGDNQSTQVGTTFEQPLEVQLTDAYGNPLSGFVVSFLLPSSGVGGSFQSSASATTDRNGRVTAPALTANEISGRFAIGVSTSGLTVNVFSLTNTPLPTPPLPEPPLAPATPPIAAPSAGISTPVRSVAPASLGIDLQRQPNQPGPQEVLIEPGVAPLLCIVRQPPLDRPVDRQLDEFRDLPDCAQSPLK
jgi:filamentous hemagglutinin family protein